MPSYFLLDTNTFRYIANGKSPRARQGLESLGESEVACLSAITEAEILFGLEKKPHARRLHTSVNHLLAKLIVLPWGREEARVFGRLRARLEAAGRTLGPMDMLIAAHAIALGATLVTNDKALLRLEGLHASENWATDV